MVKVQGMHPLQGARAKRKIMMMNVTVNRTHGQVDTSISLLDASFDEFPGGGLCLVINRVSAIPQPMGAYYSWGLNADGAWTRGREGATAQPEMLLTDVV